MHCLPPIIPLDKRQHIKCCYRKYNRYNGKLQKVRGVECLSVCGLQKQWKTCQILSYSDTQLVLLHALVWWRTTNLDSLSSCFAISMWAHALTVTAKPDEWLLCSCTWRIVSSLTFFTRCVFYASLYAFNHWLFTSASLSPCLCPVFIHSPPTAVSGIFAGLVHKICCRPRRK